jgi:hypothetical protein
LFIDKPIVFLYTINDLLRLWFFHCEACQEVLML